MSSSLFAEKEEEERRRCGRKSKRGTGMVGIKWQKFLWEVGRIK